MTKATALGLSLGRPRPLVLLDGFHRYHLTCELDELANQRHKPSRHSFYLIHNAASSAREPTTTTPFAWTD